MIDIKPLIWNSLLFHSTASHVYRKATAIKQQAYHSLVYREPVSYSLLTMYPYGDPRDPYYGRRRNMSPARNAYERPRPGYYPDDYGRVSPAEEEMPNFPDNRGRGPRDMQYPRGTGGYWRGGAPGEWEHWRRGR